MWGGVKITYSCKANFYYTRCMTPKRVALSTYTYKFIFKIKRKTQETNI